MSSWRDHILKDFIPGISKLTLVADPDGLLLEEGILKSIQERGFQILSFEDHVHFRYIYESRFRSRWDRSEQTELVVALHSPSSDLTALPYDLLQAGRLLSFNLGDLYPNLSYPVVAALDTDCLDVLFDAQKRHMPGQLGNNATKEFILRNVFEIAPELIKQPADLLKVLLRRHYNNQRIPSILDEHLHNLLSQNSVCDKWPLTEIISDRESFFAFLQERWPVFLDRMASKKNTGFWEETKEYGLKYPGPPALPFEHHDVRVYLDSLFLEGLLQPIPYEDAGTFSDTWINVGIKIDLVKDRNRRLDSLINKIKGTIPSESAKHSEWLLFARRWAELNALYYEEDDLTNIQEIRLLQHEVDASFANWLVVRYSGLINLPSIPPVIVHHIPRMLARVLSAGKDNKVALLVIDGLSIDQWVLVREVLKKNCSSILFRESNVFAWIPSITSVSRQALFAGTPPLYFPDSIHTTNKEPVLWKKFWLEQGLSQNEIDYMKGLGDGQLDSFAEFIARPYLKAVGLVIDKVDKIMHGMELGSAGMHNQVRQWAHQGHLGNILTLLLEQNFKIYITSDHGNIEAKGFGRPSEGVIAELRGERVRIYSDALFRSKIRDRYQSTEEWTNVGLPETFLPLIAGERFAFVREGEHIVCHGGNTVEELIVPLVKVERTGKN